MTENDETINDRIVMPGEVVKEAMDLAGKNKKVVLGPGLRKQGQTILSSRSGVLKRKANVFFVDSFQKRYIPSRNEGVVGTVIAKAGDIFRVDIGSSEPASLSYLAFEGATKKSRPDVNVGDVLYAKILIANRDLEPELICVDSYGRKENMGVLSDGIIFNCSINLVRKILNPKCPLLMRLKDEVPFECAVGMNGRIWIRGRNVKETVAIGNAIMAAEYISDGDVGKMCENIGMIMM